MVVTDPCETTVLAPWVIADIAIEAGLTDEQTFNRITDSAADAVSLADICGARTYEVVEIINGAEVAQTIITIEELVADTDYKMVTISLDEDTDTGVHNMRFKTTLPDALYPVLEIDFVCEILVPTCDCTLLEWDSPTSENFSTTVKKIPSDEFAITMATANEDSKSASPKIRACYRDD